MKSKFVTMTAAALMCALMGLTAAWAEESAEDLAKAAQNPVANMISIPFQNNINFNAGPQNRTQNILNIQPVIPITLGPNWNLITRTIVPVISQPIPDPFDSRINGMGTMQFSAFLSPNANSGLIWGAGTIFQLPTATNDKLGSKNFGMGPSVVVLDIKGHWVYGLLANNIFSIGGSDPTYSVGLLQPFVNYNLPDGWFLTASPIITANWKAPGADVWTVPLGGGFGRLWRIGKIGLPVNTSIQAFGNVVSPNNGADWTLRLQVQLLLPKSLF